MYAGAWWSVTLRSYLLILVMPIRRVCEVQSCYSMTPKSRLTTIDGMVPALNELGPVAVFVPEVKGIMSHII